MSAAASRHVLESLSEPFETDGDAIEDASLTKLRTISPPFVGGPVIAVDLDDVLSQTNADISVWHNEKFGTDMNVDLFYYYYYWKNPYWGTTEETFRKVTEYYSTGRVNKAQPIPGAREGVQFLRDMGYRLIVVTARSKAFQDESWQWVNLHFPNIFDSVICTEQFKDALKLGHEVVTKLTKAQVCNNLNAQLLIDDSAENALSCVTSPSPTRVLLFGDYQWNKRTSSSSDHSNEMSFDIRLKNEGKEFWKEEHLVVPEGAPLWRVKDWSEVVRWIVNARKEGKFL